jgi:hypothetical protein
VVACVATLVVTFLAVLNSTALAAQLTLAMEAAV